MKKIQFVLASVMICLMAMSCGENQPVADFGEIEQDHAGTVSENVYRNDRVGWTMNIPDGWKVMSQETTEEIHSMGGKLIEDSGQDVELGGSKTLLSLKRAFGNDSFLSMTQTWKGMGLSSAPNSFEFLNSQRDALEAMMRPQGITVDFSAIGDETIDAMTFRQYHVDLSNGMSQTYYFALLEDYYFFAVLTYSSNSASEDLFKAWASSRFDP